MAAVDTTSDRRPVGRPAQDGAEQTTGSPRLSPADLAMTALLRGALRGAALGSPDIGSRNVYSSPKWFPRLRTAGSRGTPTGQSRPGNQQSLKRRMPTSERPCRRPDETTPPGQRCRDQPCSPQRQSPTTRAPSRGLGVGPTRCGTGSGSFLLAFEAPDLSRVIPPLSGWAQVAARTYRTVRL